MARAVRVARELVRARPKGRVRAKLLRLKRKVHDHRAAAREAAAPVEDNARVAVETWLT